MSKRSAKIINKDRVFRMSYERRESILALVNAAELAITAARDYSQDGDNYGATTEAERAIALFWNLRNNLKNGLLPE